MSQDKFEFPTVIKKAVNGLDNELRWKIMESIINHGDMSYSKLMNELKLDNKGILNFHLKNLSKSALIERYEDLSSRTGDRSFYSISDIGKDIVNGLLTALNPQTKIIYFDPKKFETAAAEQFIVTYGSIAADENKSKYTEPENLIEICPAIAT